MISRCSSSSASSWTSPYSGTSCSIRRRIRSVAETAGWTPSSLKCWRLRGLLTRATIRSHAVLLLGHLADQDVVLVVAGDGDDQVSPLDAGPLEHPQLGRVPVLDGVLELLLDHPEARVIGLDQRHLVVPGDQLAGQVPADLARAGDDHVHRAPGLPSGREHYLLGLVDRVLCRADRVQALLGVPGGARRDRPPGRRRAARCSAAARSGRSPGWCCRPGWRPGTRPPPRFPASIRPSISSAVPTVNRPPASSQVVDWSLSSRS